MALQLLLSMIEVELKEMESHGRIGKMRCSASVSSSWYMPLQQSHKWRVSVN